MIPHNIQLKNFLSYGPEPQSIDFSPYNLICLSGKNGHGKSALLDAITWAIWGQARKTSGTSKADQGLLHLGQKHMFIILEFEVNGQLYRVRREFVQTNSKPFASLDFGIMQANKTMVALTDKTIKATQEKIEKTIGITYESFINSAFLRQGQSNEFSKKSPKERKEILAEILQLQQFEEQKKIALLHAKKLQQEYKTMSSIQLRIEGELEQLLNINETYQTIISAIAEHEKQKQKMLSQKKTLEEYKNSLIQKYKEIEFLTKQRTELEQQLTQNKTSIHEISQALQAHEQKKSTLSKKELEQQQKSLQLFIQSMQEKLQQKLLFKEEYLATREALSKLSAQAEKEIDQQIQIIQVDLAKYQEQLLQITYYHKQETAQAHKNKQELLALQTELHRITTIIDQNNFDLQNYQQQEQLYEQLKNRQQCLQLEITTAKEALHTAQKHCASLNNDQACCPLCTHPLSNTNQQQLHDKFTLEQTEMQKKIQFLSAEIIITQNDIQSAHVTLQSIKLKHDQSINLATQHQELSKLLQKLSVVEEESTKRIAHLVQQEKDINHLINVTQQKLSETEHSKKNIQLSAQYIEFQTKLQHIERAAKELGHNPEAHKNAELALQDINKLLLNEESIINDLDSIAEQKAILLSLTKSIHIQTEQYATLTKQLEQYNNLEVEKHKIAIQEKEINHQQIILEQTQSQLLIEKGSIEQKQRKQKDLHKELAQLLKDIQHIHQEMIDYQEIAKALGKDGIQALPIEQAIPEIEDETNEILARLTNNQTQIFIESLRDLKKGGSRETLDIKISDSFGLRDYEMFSGGEAFRIDFALRIGISKLLARRAGTTLQTIFIDEGFGSQDEEGLQLIMDNLYKIQNDFAKIIIVSHLSEMKEQFPVQFIVEKKRLGSTVSIVEQG